MVSSLRTETAGLVKFAERDLARLWRLVAAGASAGEALNDLLPAIVREYGQAGAVLASDWYDDQRAKADVAGSFRAEPLEADDRGSQSLIQWALSTATNDLTLQALILGGIQRRIADHVRYTVADNSVNDPQARGWSRVGAGGCDFCAMLIGRGAVYTEAGADFASHDHCNCGAVPAFKGDPKPVKPFTPSPRTANDADRARVREYLRTH